MKQQQNGRRRATAVVAIAAGVALLAGGSTFALWSTQAQLAAGTIQSGDLELASNATATSWDVSMGRTDEITPITDSSTNKLTFTEQTAPTTVNTTGSAGAFIMTGHTITSLTDWSIVPGDTVALVAPYTVTLKGDNLVATLSI
ncbi:MAG: hypothetical protein FWF75_02505, partial [Propionibacteriaceae bacterium]|nr:hypothetical protein [Propionibacteriaceae bacterium]